MKDEYVGLVMGPDYWWMCRDRRVFDAFDWPQGFARDMILSEAQRAGTLINLGPATMDTAHAATAARRVLGEEVEPEHGLDGFTPNTQRGRDFVDGTGEFAQDGELPCRTASGRRCASVPGGGAVILLLVKGRGTVTSTPTAATNGGAGRSLEGRRKHEPVTVPAS